MTSHNSLPAHQLEKLQKAASAAHTYFVANPSHLEMRNNIEKYRRMEGVTEEAFYDREIGNEKHWVNSKRNNVLCMCMCVCGGQGGLEEQQCAFCTLTAVININR